MLFSSDDILQVIVFSPIFPATGDFIYSTNLGRIQKRLGEKVQQAKCGSEDRRNPGLV
jgi:hypothetical protein